MTFARKTERCRMQQKFKSLSEKWKSCDLPSRFFLQRIMKTPRMFIKDIFVTQGFKSLWAQTTRKSCWFRGVFFLMMFTQNHKNKRRNLLQLFASRCGSVDCGKKSFGSQTFALAFCHENKNIVVRYRPFGGSSTKESKGALDLATKSLVVDYNGAWQMTIFRNPLLSQAFLSLTHHSVLL